MELVNELTATTTAKEDVVWILCATSHMFRVLLLAINNEAATFVVESVRERLTAVLTREVVRRVFQTCSRMIIELLETIFDKAAVSIKSVLVSLVAELAREDIHRILTADERVCLLFLRSIDHEERTVILVRKGH